MAAVAYLVLHDRSQAEGVVVEVVGHAWRHADEAEAAPQLRTWLLGLTATKALEAQRRSRAVDAVIPGSLLASGDPSRAGRDLPRVIRAFAELAPRHRAIVALRYLALLDPAETAAGLGMSQEALDLELRGALRRMRALLPEAAQDPRAEVVLPWAESVTMAADHRLEERLVATLARLTEVLPSGVEANQVRSLLAAPPPARPVPWRAVGLALLAAAVLAVVLFGILGGSPGTGGATRDTPSQPGAATPSRPSASPGGVEAGAPPITLASCDITPANTPLAFAGWATADTLRIPNAAVGAGQPVYVLVTQRLAQMVTGRESGGWINPPPFSRLACFFNPATGASALAGVPFPWQPPAIIDGCPASSEDSFAGYREIGGPRAWFVVPLDMTGWVAGSSESRLFRLAPDIAPGQQLTAWAQPLAGGARIAGTIEPGRPVVVAPSPGASVPAPSSEANYRRVTLRPTLAGCWVINIAVDGEVVGSAIVPIVEAAGGPTPRQSPIVP